MRKIESLSDEQWRRVHEERERWIRIGTSTEPADRETTERVIRGFYRRIGRAEPAFVWLDGPASCALALGALRAAGKDLGQLRDQLWGQLRKQLGGQLGGQLRDQLKDQLWVSINESFGEWNTAWSAYYATVRDAAGVSYATEHNSLLREWEELVSACGWWFPTAAVCFCAERHEVTRFDSERRLHCETGPALRCRDGFEVYAWHGTRVPSGWITQPKDAIDPAIALTWENIEQRRCLAEIIGWARVLGKLSPTVVDTGTEAFGQLLRVDLPDAPGEQFLRVTCGTGREFVLPVPPTVKTAREANAWTYGLETKQLNPEVRT